MERINNSTKEFRDAVLAINRQWMDAYSRGDAIGVGAFYTDDAQSPPPNSDAILGMQAIVEYRKTAMEMRIKGSNIETKEVESLNGYCSPYVKTALSMNHKG